MNTRILIGAFALLGLAATVRAQSAPPAPGVAPEAGSAVPPPALVLPVSTQPDPLADPLADQLAVPAAPAQATAAPAAQAPAVQAPARQAGPASLSGVGPAVMSDDDLTREVARIRAHIEVLDANQDLLKAQAANDLQVIQNEIERRKLSDELAGMSRAPAASAAAPAGGTTASASAAAAPVEIQPVVRSIYGYDGQSFAEIYIGGAKILATQGTVLATGHRVVAIGPGGVELLRKGRRSVLHVAGSAGVNPVAPPGLPPGP